jgi:large subunit ribosomal protein L5
MSADKPDKPEKPAKTPKAPKPEKGEKAPKGEKTPKGEKAPKGEKPEKGKKGGKPSKQEAAEPQVVPTPRLQERYAKEIVPALAEHLKRTNRLSLPRLQKIVVNMGVGSAIAEKKYLEEAVDALRTLAGQKPVVTRSRQSIAGFKLREGMAIGCKVTLRGKRMYEFLDRLIALALPRVRDFRGLNPNGFDGHGNYSLGLTEQLVFPELNPDKFTKPQGMNITLVTSTQSDDEARDLLRRLGMPLRAA